MIFYLGERGQRNSYDMNSQMHPLAASTTDMDTGSIIARAGSSASMSGTSFGLGLGLYSNERGDAGMRRATVPLGNLAGSGSMATGWIGATGSQGLPANAANYTMTDPNTASMSSTAARRALPSSPLSSPSP